LWFVHCRLTTIAEHALDTDDINERTPDVIKMCMTQTCFDQGLKSNSADQMKSALVAFYKRKGVKYQGPFHLAADGNWHGNPASTETVKKYVLELKSFDDAAQRSQPMSYQDCEKAKAWLESVDCTLNEYQVQLFKMAMATGFTLWFVAHILTLGYAMTMRISPFDSVIFKWMRRKLKQD
jgi:hypothetical protein